MRTDAPAQQRRGLALWLTVLADAWFAAIILAAVTLPVYSRDVQGRGAGASTPGLTLVAQNGWRVLLPIVIPAVLAALASGALYVTRARGGRIARVVAGICIAMVVLINGVALLGSVGVFLAPASAALVWSYSLSTRATQA
jgi:hypothetical protein